jgi:rhodanese-related sulfurtransferase
MEGPMDVQRISVTELKRRLDAHEPVTVLDSRSPQAWEGSDRQIPGSVRVPPDEVDAHLSGIPHDGLIVSYCT